MTPELKQRINNALAILNWSVARGGGGPPGARRGQKRDLTQEQFEHRAEKAGWKKNGPPLDRLGYWSLTNGVHVSVFNAGHRRRDWLKYLARMEREQARRGKP